MDVAAGRGARKVAKIFFFPAHEEGSVLHVYVQRAEGDGRIEGE